jgi:thymidylate synthase
MYFKAKTLDDVLRRVLKKLTNDEATSIKASRGESSEVTGVLFQITRPRARLSRTEKRGLIFSPLGELFWYLAGSESLRQIAYYVPKYKKESTDKKTIYGAYGPRLFQKEGRSQIDNVLDLLRRKPWSRRAVVQIVEARDLAHEQVPCTCTLQFLIRKKQLHMYVYMRSNDAFMGLPHDVFAFTMIQELMARSLAVEMGSYKHMVGSLHLYDEHLASAKQYLKEDWQETEEMPPMPPGDPWVRVKQMVRWERTLRAGTPLEIDTLDVELYWKDLLRLLQIFAISKKEKSTRSITALKKKMSSKVYDAYIDQRRKKLEQKVEDQKPIQVPMFNTSE